MGFVCLQIQHRLVDFEPRLPAVLRGRHFHVQLHLLAREIPREDEKAEQHEENVHDRGNLKPQELRLGTPAKFHGRRIC